MTPIFRRFFELRYFFPTESSDLLWAIHELYHKVYPDGESWEALLRPCNPEEGIPVEIRHGASLILGDPPKTFIVDAYLLAGIRKPEDPTQIVPTIRVWLFDSLLAQKQSLERGAKAEYVMMMGKLDRVLEKMEE